jgi:curved DNA-binding protein CbpA
MVAQRSPSLYELLEVSSGATFEEIEQSYQRIAAYLGADSLAVYSILESDDAQQMRTQLDEAYRTLSDPDRRAAYDRARREDYPPITVPAQPRAATSTADEHQMSAAAQASEADNGYAADHGDALGEWQKGDVHDKHLPVRGRGQARQPIRGPGARTGRTPLYGRDVTLQGRDPRSASDVQARENKPRYGRSVGKTEEPAREQPPEAQYRKPAYGRWSTRGEDDMHHRYEPPREEARRDETRREDPRSSDLWAPPSPPPERAEARPTYQSDEVTPPPPPPAPVARVERDPELPRIEPVAAPPPPPRVEARPPERMERISNPPELIKTTSDVVEPRQKSTVPAPAALSATAKSKRKILKPTITVTADTEFNGGVLRNLRESAGASLDELAEMTKVGKRHLIAIESNDFAALPAAVYTRGFVAELARAMGLDPTPVAKSYMALFAKHRGAGG